ncbi:23S rRNA (adenine(2503)-C(2))-methyltransferase RlmN [Caproiciproducens galactitolivorans]|uniref:Probable dual-specificity RNA methyltransferase RlmN n=1 Tax=Caproiciproducens galactitolivorans TaxID=642589 RepID=A0A4Z0YI61_9FIRM|nr:23S rRNA (adenine(2503)-C(2))-methyltransferase RlmN [Caproiciproducens galactitolivorans]QEY34037.1 23S rRNA (adenine(2503)-C(2))-methyltransferase RlmN [Caproiciproducens galactitolivorans]TGJ76552.1 putative dual-specificity RNA methyltransferase RlmN [Caproiciproducens galactitolivorans]
MSQQDIKSMTLDELKADFAADGQPAFRALQVYKWVHRGVFDFEEMSDQSKAFRQRLSERYYIANAVIEKKLESKLDGTIKYLFRLNDGEHVESVLMDYHHGHTICISTQVGCKMNCSFCATGKSGFSRNLKASEMLAQIQAAQKDIGIRISNVVMMGMGEPLDNYEQVLRFLELVTSDDGMNIGMRHISLSTCGIVDKIYDLAERKLQLTLSVSLHAPNDSIRARTMPVNRKWGVDELLKACRYYAKITGRRVSYEYAMISGVNDSDACAAELAEKLSGSLSHVNLIPVNAVNGIGFKKSSNERLQKFIRILSNKGITATVRRTLGSDINASCGQLRRRYKEEVANVENLQ